MLCAVQHGRRARLGRYGAQLPHASEELQDDKEFMLTVAHLDGCELRYASEALRDDKDLALTAVTQTGQALSVCSERLRNDKEALEPTLAPDPNP